MSDKRKSAGLRGEYRHFLPIPTRWIDNDVYGHVNNVVYYAYFDTIINRYLIDEGKLDFHNDAIIGIAVETSCRFFRSFAYPELVEAGMRVGHLGRSSVRYEVGLFGQGEKEARAEGHFVHVFVERESQRPVAVPEQIRQALAKLVTRT
ncbi:MAG: acyl-CoA thioesterase [Hyphomicrobiaceae bacterium]|nr:MAG: acyl-CoA thioesterase [Hyphomicrobiaceae bacterium]